ncbi:hypothetical protein [Staphylococcus gallinarum]|uniref:hypothetical protein n=1 Tax=Staphylococcus gallinarum TaxID=1293 RepID=UPI001E43BEEA|nr:hypothetical protein [Staphylococcus gallinarum]MCD8828791.1 hypothetical protein [Staphylococcus gallinarum]MCD8902701.1 hypothetical protein [Staphylococcus gallinarum]MEB6055536.1 hypothetical protein [Staphylococcus gallinarum]
MSLFLNILIIIMVIQFLLGMLQLRTINKKINEIKSNYSKQYKINISLERKFKVFKVVLITVWKDERLISIYSIESKIFKIKVRNNENVKNKKIQSNINMYLRGDTA